MSFESIVVSLHACSNKRFRCITGLGKVFAVPRARLMPDSTYAISDSMLKVEKCIQGNSKVCQTALISSACKKSLNGGCIIPGLQEGNKKKGNKKKGNEYDGPTLYFIYNEAVGVTAYGESSKPLSNLKTKMSVATRFILSGDTGILGPLKKVSK